MEKMVNFQLRTGNDFVQSQMFEAAAMEIIKNGTVTESDREDFPICVNDQYYFPDLLNTAVNKPKAKSRKKVKE